MTSALANGRQLQKLQAKQLRQSRNPKFQTDMKDYETSHFLMF